MNQNSTAREVAKLEADMAERPVVIHWRLDPVRRVQVAWYVDDPYMTGGPNGDKTHCRHNHEFTPENTILKSDGARQCRTCKNQAAAQWHAANPQVLTPEQRARKSEQERLRRQRQRELAAMEDEAYEVAERFRKHRADNTPLLAAARTEI